MTPTQLLVLRPDGPAEIIELGPEEASSYSALNPRLRALIGEMEIEHVSVWHDSRRRDMFVAEDSGLHLPNKAATLIYQAWLLYQEPTTDPETLPAIYGTAVVCGQIVWH